MGLGFMGLGFMGLGFMGLGFVGLAQSTTTDLNFRFFLAVNEGLELTKAGHWYGAPGKDLFVFVLFSSSYRNFNSSSISIRIKTLCQVDSWSSRTSA